MKLPIMLVLSFAALASPPAGVNEASPLSDWFNSLRQNDYPRASCCSVADCRPIQSRTRDGHWEVYYKGAWYVVPDSVIIRGIKNPTGEAVACISPNLTPTQVLCFIKPPET